MNYLAIKKKYIAKFIVALKRDANEIPSRGEIKPKNEITILAITSVADADNGLHYIDR